ncbi:MAG: DUF4920 domain-containing protein [Bacteroidia bacterium]|jgi:hypothetical protein
MRNFHLVILGMTLLLSACQETVKDAKNEDKGEFYGSQITKDGAEDAARLPELMQGKDSLRVKLAGTINSCCQKKGCWMMVDLGNDQEMRVSFKDYAFFVPLESAGRKVIMEGIARYEVTTVEDLKHFAEDAGKSQAEIDSITQPDKELVFEASGVILL